MAQYNEGELINNFLVFRQKDQKNMREDYGKYIEDKELQEPFARFLKREKRASNEEADHYWLDAQKAKDNSEKIRLLLQGAEEGNALCAYEIGSVYYAGKTEYPIFAYGEKNLDLAEKYLKFAAECGVPSAMGFLGLLYAEGKGGDKFLEGVRWMCMSIINGEMFLYKKIGDICRVESTNTLFNLHFAVYFREICDKETHTAKENQFLGWCFFEGMCCIQNLDKAKMYWQVGEEQGNPNCRVLLQHEIFRNESAKKAAEFQVSGNNKKNSEGYENANERMQDSEKCYTQQCNLKTTFKQYAKEKKKFEEQYEYLPEIVSHRKNIDNARNQIVRLDWKNNRERFGLGWIFGIGLPGLLFFFFNYIGAWLLKSDVVNSEDLTTLLLSIIPTIGAIVVIILCFVLNDTLHPFIYSLIIVSVIGTILIFIIEKLLRILVFAYQHFGVQIHTIGILALFLVFVLVLKKILREFQVGSRKRKMKQLDRYIDSEFNKIGEVIQMEYEKIYDKYEEAGEVRDSVTKARNELLAKYRSGIENRDNI